MIKINIKPNYPNTLVSFTANNQSLTLEYSLRGGVFYGNLYLGNDLAIAGTPILHRTPINLYATETQISGYVYVIVDDEDRVLTLDNIGVTANFYWSSTKPNSAKGGSDEGI